jgi:glycosyltransferase involved in cell wall biosynthesis
MKDITFVLMTCGEITENKCLEAIESFRDQIEFAEVRNVFPQIKALNQMIESVQTEYFVPLDADILLHPNAWERISNAWRKHWRDPEWHSILFPLWDTLTEKNILALKLMRTSVMKENLFSESATPDVEHYQRLTSKGYTCIHDYLKQSPIGDHVVTGEHFCYHKYRDLYQTYRSHNFEWDSGAFLGGEDLKERANSHFNFFLYKWVMTENTDYLCAIAGMMDGILSPIENKSKSLESHEYWVSKEYAIEAYLEWQIEDAVKYMNGVMF